MGPFLGYCEPFLGMKLDTHIPVFAVSSVLAYSLFRPLIAVQ